MIYAAYCLVDDIRMVLEIHAQIYEQLQPESFKIFISFQYLNRESVALREHLIFHILNRFIPGTKFNKSTVLQLGPLELKFLTNKVLQINQMKIYRVSQRIVRRLIKC